MVAGALVERGWNTVERVRVSSPRSAHVLESVGSCTPKPIPVPQKRLQRVDVCMVSDPRKSCRPAELQVPAPTR